MPIDAINFTKNALSFCFNGVMQISINASRTINNLITGQFADISADFDSMTVLKGFLILTINASSVYAGNEVKKIIASRNINDKVLAYHKISLAGIVAFASGSILNSLYKNKTVKAALANALVLPVVFNVSLDGSIVMGITLWQMYVNVNATDQFPELRRRLIIELLKQMFLKVGLFLLPGCIYQLITSNHDADLQLIISGAPALSSSAIAHLFSIAGPCSLFRHHDHPLQAPLLQAPDNDLQIINQT